jgi:predicted Zn-dependent protease
MEASGFRASSGWFTVVLVSLCTTGAAITLVSVQDEIAIGREAQAQVRAKVPELRDTAIAGYVRSIGRQLAAHARGPRYPYSFSVADYREINAFALPGGPVWIHRGAMAAAQNEAQLAGILAHEIAHIDQRHAADRLTKVVVANGLLGFLGAVLGNDGGARAAQIGAQLLAGGIFLKFSRDDEREADQVGVQIMHRAGWDPRGMVEFLQILRQRAGRDPGSVEVFLSTHPPPEGRIERLQQTSARLRGGRRQSSNFQTMQQRLRRLPPARSMPRR